MKNKRIEWEHIIPMVLIIVLSVAAISVVSLIQQM